MKQCILCHRRLGLVKFKSRAGWVWQTVLCTSQFELHADDYQFRLAPIASTLSSANGLANSGTAGIYDYAAY